MHMQKLTFALFLSTTPRHVLYVLPTLICCRFLVSTQHSLPVVWALLRPQYGTHSLLTFALVLHHILSVVFLKPTALIRPSVPPSGSHKSLRFGLWSTLCTTKDLFTYLLTSTLEKFSFSFFITFVIFCLFSCLHYFDAVDLVTGGHLAHKNFFKTSLDGSLCNWATPTCRMPLFAFKLNLG